MADTSPTDNWTNSGSKARWNQLLDGILERSKRVTERKQDRSKRTEKQILQSALRVFARDGISRSRIADIAAEAGISTSTLYEYYKCKEDLAYEVPMSYLDQFFRAYKEDTAEEPSAKKRLDRLLSFTTDYSREHVEWARLFYLELWPSVAVSESNLIQTIDDFMRILTFLLKEGIAEGWVSPNRKPNETGAIVIGGINQTIITWLLYRTPPNLTKAGSEMSERIITLLEMEAKDGNVR